MNAMSNRLIVDEAPTDQKSILEMLVQPQTFGQGLFDYSCHGNNWVICDKVVSSKLLRNSLGETHITYTHPLLYR